MRRSRVEVGESVLILLLAVILASSGWAMAEDNADAIIQHSVEANKRDWDAAPGFDCLERDRESDGTKTYEDTMILGLSLPAPGRDQRQAVNARTDGTEKTEVRGYDFRTEEGIAPGTIRAHCEIRKGAKTQPSVDGTDGIGIHF